MVYTHACVRSLSSYFPFCAFFISLYYLTRTSASSSLVGLWRLDKYNTLSLSLISFAGLQICYFLRLIAYVLPGVQRSVGQIEGSERPRLRSVG